MPLNDPLMTKADVAKVLRCCQRTLERRLRAGEFPPPARFGKELLWFTSTIRAWLERERAKQQQWLADPSEAAVPEPTDMNANEDSSAHSEPTTGGASVPGRRQRRVKPRRSELERAFSPFSDEDLAAAHC